MVIWPPAVVTSRRSLQPDLNERVQRKRRQLQKQKPETTATKDTTAAVKAGYAPRNAEVLWQVEKLDRDPTAGLNFLYWHLDAQEFQASKGRGGVPGSAARSRACLFCLLPPLCLGENPKPGAPGYMGHLFGVPKSSLWGPKTGATCGSRGMSRSNESRQQQQEQWSRRGRPAPRCTAA
jgi:hypothetical protein